jgi:aryl-alcohol dehydrogenase-like predicted oxidoreductase
MPKLALGTANFGFPYGISNQLGQILPDSVADILQVAKHAGIGCLDTAVAYGKSQKVLGEIGVSGWRLVSKISSIELGCEDVSGYVNRQVEIILGDLQVSSIDTVLVHNAQDLIGENGDQIFSELQKFRQHKLISKIGVSIYGPTDLETISSRYPIEVVQAPLNVLDNRIERSGWLEKLSEHKIEVLTRSLFLQGLLISRELQKTALFQQWCETFKRWNDFSDASGRSDLANCVGHVKSFDQVSQIVVGVDSATQLREIVDAFSSPAQKVDGLEFEVDQKLIDPSMWGQ